MFDHLTAKTIYLIILGLVIVIEHNFFYERWRHHELARRTAGIATVMTGALILAIIGAADFNTWALIMAGFCLAGAITGALHVTRHAREQQERAARMREAIDAEAAKTEKDH